MVNGGMLAIDNIIPHSPAIVEAFYPGFRAGLFKFKYVTATATERKSFMRRAAVDAGDE
jgi:hypothetical protein